MTPNELKVEAIDDSTSFRIQSVHKLTKIIFYDNIIIN
jgi:hypothetical protein